ncbi:MAG: RIP metalloprotease RseP, partial [Acidobacteriota bacterium]
MTYIWAFLLVLGVLVFVHELGHFLMARRIGVRVLTFSLGFGPKLLKTKRGDTEYAISAIPLGGYVKMAGENPDEQLTGKPDEFMSRSKWERFLVYIAGPAMNLILALVVMTFVLYQGADVPAYENQPVVIGRVVENSPAAKAGLQPGDRIIEVNNREVPTWEHYSVEILPKAGRPVNILVLRGNERRSFELTPIGQTKYEIGDIGVQPQVHPQIAAVTPGEPAAGAGLKQGDVILAIDGKQNVQNEDLVKHIRAHDGQPVSLTVRRGGTTQQVSVTPRAQKIGVQLSPFELRTVEPGFVQAIG